MSKSTPTTKKRTNWYNIFLLLNIVFIVLSTIIPYYIVYYIQEEYMCSHHVGGIDGEMWLWGRALGWTTLIWFCISTFQGFTTNKHAKLFHGKKKAKNFHCISALITIAFLGLHVYLLMDSKPWNQIIFRTNIEHLGYGIFMIKIWTGVIFAIAMVSISILSIYLKDMKRLKKFGYKKFIWVHRIMLILIIILVIHILFINTELSIMGYSNVNYGGGDD